MKYTGFCYECGLPLELEDDTTTCNHCALAKSYQDLDQPYRLRDEGRNPDGTGESYAERNR